MSYKDDIENALIAERESRRRQKKMAWIGNLLVCGGCLSVLGAILIPNFIRARGQDSGTACKSNLKNIGSALSMYSSDWDGKYPSSLKVLTPNYLKTLPECPPARAMTYKAYYGPKAPMNVDGYEDYYYVECHGPNHEAIGITGHYPAYNGVQGLVERSAGPAPARAPAIAGQPTTVASASPQAQNSPAKASTPKTRLAQCDANLKEISQAVDVYALEHKAYPTSLQALVPTYIEALPRCPNATSDTYGPGLEVGPKALHNPAGKQDFFYICCQGTSHADAGIMPDNPVRSTTRTPQE